MASASARGPAMVVMALTLLNVPTSCAADDQPPLNATYTGPADIWDRILWNRFPREFYPLFLSPLIERGRIQEAQRLSRVHNIGGDVESYSGYITVEERYDSNMFFWFFPAVNKETGLRDFDLSKTITCYTEYKTLVKEKAPVLLWLNGGPGRTSLVGALLENGPLTLRVDGNTTVIRSQVSWTESFSMLYIDNPVGVGYSFTRDDDGYSTSMEDISRNLYRVLVQFFKMFPQYAKNEFYAGGQSFAGKYVPSLGRYIHDRNTDPTPPDILINFKGIYLGAGYCDPENMMPAFYDYLYHAGLISNTVRRNFRQKVIRLIRDGLAGKETKSPRETNTRLLGPLHAFRELPFTRASLHAGLAQDIKHVIFNDRAVSKLRDVFLPSTSPENAFLMDNYKVLHYSGNLDVIVNVPMTEAFLEQVAWSGQQQYRQHHRDRWMVNDKLAGWFVTIGNFTRVIVRNAGHMVPYDQPEHALDMMRRFVFNDFAMTNGSGKGTA